MTLPDAPKPDGPKPILVVDDDRDLATMMKKFLEHHGFRVVVVTDPRSAITRCIDAGPALVLVDLMMPYLDGEDLVRQLRGVLHKQTPAIVLVSASHMRAEVQKRLALPASLSKPFTMDDLLGVCMRFASEHRAEQKSSPQSK
jgi:DNA-binding response OmpR family regulator